MNPAQPSWSWAKRALLWPKNQTTRRHVFPWWLIAWRAPFVAVALFTLFCAAVVCALMTFFINPRDTRGNFERILNA